MNIEMSLFFFTTKVEQEKKSLCLANYFFVIIKNCAYLCPKEYAQFLLHSQNLLYL